MGVVWNGYGYPPGQRDGAKRAVNSCPGSLLKYVVYCNCCIAFWLRGLVVMPSLPAFSWFLNEQCMAKL